MFMCTILRLSRNFIPAVFRAEYPLQQAMEVIEEPAKEGEPKGFWKRLWDNVEPYYPGTDSLFERENRRFNEYLLMGVIPSSIYNRARDDVKQENVDNL